MRQCWEKVLVATSNEAMIRPGDILFGDVDGVVVIPRELENVVVAKALEQVRKEKTARRLLLKASSADSVFIETGVL